ncbi:MAG: tetratricopeptide repeat protein [Actinomycetes bacterium]
MNVDADTTSPAEDTATDVLAHSDSEASESQGSWLDRMSDKTLNRLLKWGVVALVIAFCGFGAFYFWDQRVDSGPSLQERAVQGAEDAASAAPNSIPARLALGQAYRSVGRLDDAMAQYDEVLKASADNLGALSGRAVTLYLQGKNDEAADVFKKVTTSGGKGEFAGVDTRLQEAYYYMGLINLAKGAYPEAITNLQSALKIDGGDSDALYQLGIAQLKAGKNADAVMTIRKALLFVPLGWCEPFGTLNEAYNNVGNAPEAEWAAAMQQACQEQGGVDTAKARLEALTTGPAAPDAMVALGLLAEKAADRDAAAAWYAKALAAQPGNPDATAGKARVAQPSAGKAPADSAHSDTTGSQKNGKQ